MKIGFIGFGEAGYTIGRALREAGLEELFAYDIAWQGLAETSSLIEAVRVAARLVSGGRQASLSAASR